MGPYDPYYILSVYPDPYPPDITSYLNNDTIKSKIGAQSTWTESSDDVYFNFAATGDWMHNSRPLLEKVIDAGVRTVVYDGDAVRAGVSGYSLHMHCWLRRRAAIGLYSELHRRRSNGTSSVQSYGDKCSLRNSKVDALQTQFTDEYAKQDFTNFTVAGQAAGMYKNAGTFSYVRIFGA